MSVCKSLKVFGFRFSMKIRQLFIKAIIVPAGPGNRIKLPKTRTNSSGGLLDNDFPTFFFILTRSANNNDKNRVYFGLGIFILSVDLSQALL